ncbi:hypothetical protein V6U90_22770 [Micromonospora sp. CPCC 206060]
MQRAASVAGRTDRAAGGRYLAVLLAGLGLPSEDADQQTSG